MSTEFFNDQWRIPSNENQNKISNYSMEFDGSGSDVIDIGSQAFNPDHSISFWINSVVSGPNSYGGILAGGANSISIDQGGGVIGVGKIYFRISSVNYTVSSTIVSETWNHVVFTRNGTNVKCYINGVLDKTTTVPVYSTWQYIGAQLASGNNPFNGKLDQLTIFNYELSQDQVTQLGAAEGYAFNFNGTNDSIQIPTNSNLEITGNMTISAWIKSSSSSTGSTKIINKRNASSTNFDFFLDTGGTKLKFFDGTDNIASDISITLGVWNHVAITIQSGVTNGSIFYVNGVAQATNLPTFTIASNTAPLVIGANFTRNGTFFNGEISNVSIFNSNLSASNITTLYNNGSPLASMTEFTSLQGWWKLDNTTTGIEDSKGSSNGTNNGAIEYAGFVNALAGESAGMTSANLVQSDLQHTSGYSPYALDFDGVDNYLDCGTNPFDETTGDITLSAWVKKTSGTGYQPIVAATQGGVGTSTYFSFQFSGANLLSIFWDGTAGGNLYVVPSSEFTVVNGNWYLINFVRTGTVGTIYVNGSLVSTSTKTYNNFSFADRPDITLGGWNFNTSARLNGELSNVSLWNSALTSAQITEVYNEGVPSNLNNHSAYSNLISWWQLGSNSSFNTNWTVLNEISTGLDGVSQGVMTNDEIVNGPGYSANGLGTSSIDIVGDAPYSIANGLSENMDVLDRTTDVPS